MTILDRDLSQVHCEVCDRPRLLMVDEIPGLGTMTSRCVDCVAAGAYPLPTLVSATAVMGGMFFAPTWWQDVVEDTQAHFGLTHEEFLGLVEDWASTHLRRGVDYG